jgi:uncharacterized protein DUF1918
MPEHRTSVTEVAAGDRVLVHAHRQGEPERDAEILEVLHAERPAYRVRWDDGRESILYPGSDVTVEHYHHRSANRRCG